MTNYSKTIFPKNNAIPWNDMFKIFKAPSKTIANISVLFKQFLQNCTRNINRYKFKLLSVLFIFLLSTIYDLTSLRLENKIKHLLFNMENNQLKQKKCTDNDINEINNFMGEHYQIYINWKSLISFNKFLICYNFPKLKGKVLFTSTFPPISFIKVKIAIKSYYRYNSYCKIMDVISLQQKKKAAGRNVGVFICI